MPFSCPFADKHNANEHIHAFLTNIKSCAFNSFCWSVFLHTDYKILYITRFTLRRLTLAYIKAFLKNLSSSCVKPTSFVENSLLRYRFSKEPLPSSILLFVGFGSSSLSASFVVSSLAVLSLLTSCLSAKLVVFSLLLSDDRTSSVFAVCSEEIDSFCSDF